MFLTNISNTFKQSDKKYYLKDELLIIISIFLHLLLLVIIFFEPVLINNGDYGRMVRGFVDIPAFSDVASCSDLHPRLTIFGSSMGGLFLIAAGTSKIIGIDCLDNKIISYILFLILASGSYCAIKHSKKNAGSIAVLASLSVAFSFLFSSYYEEAIIIPLVAWVIFGASKLQLNGRLTVFVISSSLLVFAKAQMLLFAPLLVCILVISCKRFPVTKKAIFLAALLILASALAVNLAKKGNSLPNSYNRLYNGIGWSIQGVKDWPARNFAQRHEYFYKKAIDLQLKSVSHEIVHGEMLMGTSYWPTGRVIFENGIIDDDNKKNIKESISFTQYFKSAFDIQVFPVLMASTYLVSLSSDYSIEYLYGGRQTTFQNIFGLIRSPILQNFGWIYYISFGIIFIYWKSNSKFIAILHIIGFSLVVVLGDGFYEFEKHLVTFFIASPVLFVLREIFDPVRKNA